MRQGKGVRGGGDCGDMKDEGMLEERCEKFKGEGAVKMWKGKE